MANIAIGLPHRCDTDQSVVLFRNRHTEIAVLLSVRVWLHLGLVLALTQPLGVLRVVGELKPRALELVLAHITLGQELQGFS